MIKRIFVVIPMCIMAFIIMITVVTPLIYWIITGKELMARFMENIDNYVDSIN